MPKPHVTSDEIRSLRETLGESQQQFAARLGCSTRTVSNWENGHPPTGAVALLLIKLREEQRQKGNATADD